jgi:hypothetical protein
MKEKVVCGKVLCTAGGGLWKSVVYCRRWFVGKCCVLQEVVCGKVLCTIRALIYRYNLNQQDALFTII